VRFALPQILIASVTIALTVVAGFVVSPLIAPVFLLAAPILVRSAPSMTRPRRPASCG
jgi:Flp pilus assembly protein TadB